MKRWVFVILVAFSVTLAVVVGKRMSTDAMAVVVGIACGVAASIPTSLLIVAVATRRGERERRDYPPVVVINPGSSQPQYLQPPYPPLISQGPRQFRIVGQEEEAEIEKKGFF